MSRSFYLHQDHVELHQREPAGTGTIKMTPQNIHSEICTGPCRIAPAETSRHQNHKDDTTLSFAPDIWTKIDLAP